MNDDLLTPVTALLNLTVMLLVRLAPIELANGERVITLNGATAGAEMTTAGGRSTSAGEITTGDENTAGAGIRTTKLSVAAGPVLPAGSVARTVKLCSPAASPLLVCTVLVVHSAAIAPSSEQVMVEPASEAANPKLGLVTLTSLPTGLVILVVGATVSTVHDLLAGPLTLPATSTARTENEWAPWARAVKLAGLVHAASAAPSREHRKVTPASPSRKAKEALALLTRPAGPAVIPGTGGAAESCV